MKIGAMLAIGAGALMLMGLFGKERFVDRHKKKLEELASAAQYSYGSATVMRALQLQATLVVGELLLDVRREIQGIGVDTDRMATSGVAITQKADDLVTLAREAMKSESDGDPQPSTPPADEAP